jgi:hypothetical protein
MKEQDSDATKYVKSLRDAVKRRFATDYHQWLKQGKTGPAPARGALSPTDWRTVRTNLEALS